MYFRYDTSFEMAHRDTADGENSNVLKGSAAESVRLCEKKMYITIIAKWN